MERNTQILIGLGIVGGLYYLYTLNNKKKSSALELQQKTALKNKIKSYLVSKEAKTPMIPTGRGIGGGIGAINNKQNMIDKLLKTIEADLLSIEELQKIADGLDVSKNNYVGTKSRQEIINQMNEVTSKYQIEIND
jgi:hypothetical protein